MKGRSTAPQKGKGVVEERLDRGPSTGIEEGELQDKTPPRCSHTPSMFEDQRGASILAPAPPVPSPDASVQEMRQAILLLTQLVAAQAQRQDGDHDNRGWRKGVNSSQSDRGFRGVPPQFPRPRFDGPTYSRSPRDLKASSSQMQSGSSQKRSSVPRCTQCRRLHGGPCRRGSDVCYACARPGHVKRNCPSLRGKGKVRVTEVVADSSSPTRPPRPRSQMLVSSARDRRTPSPSGSQHHIHALAERRDFESSPDMAPGILLAPLYD